MDFRFDLQRFTDSPIVVDQDYQLRWNVSSDDNVGLFPVTVSLATADEVTTATIKGTVAEQAAKTTFALPTTGTKYYLAVQNSYADGLNTLSVVGLYAATADGVEAVEFDAVSSSSLVTITAPTSAPLVFNGTAVEYPVTINKLATGSAINLKEGDTATTGALQAGDVITGVGVLTAALGEMTYIAATNGTTLTFVGETSGDTSVTALQAGNVQLTATLDEGDLTVAGILLPDGNTVTTTDTDGLVVKVAKGKVTSITGLSGFNTIEDTTTPAQVRIVETSTQTVSSVEINNTTTTTTYIVLDEDGTMIQKNVSVSVNGGEPTVATTYLDLSKAGGEIYSASYKAASITNVIGAWADGTANATSGVFYYLGTDADAAAVAAAATTNLVTAANVVDADSPTGRAVSSGKFQAIAGGYYLKVNSTTKSATATTTINSFEVYRGNAAGALTKVSSPAYADTLTYDADGLAIVYTKKTSGNFHIIITNAGIYSKFTNLADGDVVTTADTAGTELSAGIYTVYNAGAVHDTVTVSGGKVTAAVDDGAITSIVGLDKGEKVTIVTATDTGTVTRVIQATTASKVTITDTDVDGEVSVYKDVDVEDLSTTNILAIDGGEPASTSIVADFDWTTNKSVLGYFAVSGGSGTKATATVATGKTTISGSVDGKQYVRVALGDEGAISLSAVEVDAGLDFEQTTFKGTLTIKAPSTAIKLTDRGVEATTLKITNLAAGSSIAADAFTGENDTITTAKLAEGGTITLGTAEYVAGGANAVLTINQSGLYSGLVKLAETTSVTVGSYKFANANEGGTTSITVNASSGKTFTLGSLDDGDKVTITDNSGDTPVVTTFTKYGSYLYNSDRTAMYAVSNGFASGKLLTESNWKDTIDLADDDAVLGTTTVNLALADKAIAAGDAPVAFVRDRYVTTALTGKSNVTASVATMEDMETGANYILGHSDTLGEGYVGDAIHGLSHAYGAVTSQTINVTTGWEVTAARGYATTIKGAASGTDYIAANTGDDTITLSGATDTVDERILGGEDTITGYASGKDKIVVAEEAHFVLSTDTANDVYITGEDGDITEDYALLKNVGGKAVTITIGDTTSANVVALSAAAGGSTLKGGTLDLSNADNYNSIDAVDASGVKATSAAISLYGTKFVKAHAGVNVTASASGTSFTGSAFGI